MPWKETSVMNERLQLLGEWLTEEYSVTALAEEYGVARKTVHKWIQRYRELGVEGLRDRSRAPGHCPWAVRAEVRDRIVATKLKYPRFGPKKVLDYLRRTQPAVRWPADSTGGEILRRAGLVRKRKARRRVPGDGALFLGCDAPNRVWSADYKGEFRTGDGRWCYPLTMTDNHSRYLLLCRGLPRTTTAKTRPWMEWAFREYGLPEALRTDNGAPFASRAVGGLTLLSKWWIQLGVKPERIRPATPTENGRHERMHRELKGGTARPPARNAQAQQVRFDEFTREFNEERSHEGIGRRTPASVYHPSPRAYPAKVPPVEYTEDVTVRRVRHNGEIKWKGRLLYITSVLAQEPVGLQEIGEGRWEIRYSFHVLGELNEHSGKVIPVRTWHDK